jgi:KipI family sensor histidine kinase inhibitor
MVRVLAAGPRALLVEVAGLATALGLQAEIERRRAAGALPGVVEVVPGARTVLIDGVDDPGRLAALIRDWPIEPIDHRHGALVEIPVVYDGEDLAFVAECWGVRPDEVGEIHAATTYDVAFCGFGPGFAYLAGLPPQLAVSRREAPRPRIPPGTVAIAGAFTGIYPRLSPGGWRLIGHTDERMWDANRTPAALLLPGMRVQFVNAAR